MKNSLVQKRAWSEVTLEALTPQLSRRVVSGQQVMAAHVILKAGCIVPKHAHVNEQVTYVLEGTLRFWFGEKVNSNDVADAVDVAAGELLIIPSNVPHRALALQDTLELDIFAPPREDWLSGTDDYLRAR